MIRYDLQFFANTDGPGGQKTEPATAKKLKDARDKGQVSKSHDLTGAVMLLATFILIRIYVGSMGTSLINQIVEGYNRIGEWTSASVENNSLINYFSNLINHAIVDMIIILLPIMLVAFAISLIGDLIQVGWKPTAEPMKPKGEKINPLKGFQRIFSAKTLVQLVKQIIIIAVCVIVAYNKIKDVVYFFFNLYDITIEAAIAEFGEIVTDIGINISVIYLIVGVGDFIYEKYKFKTDMKMTKQEIKDEWKDTEGSPEVKNSQRRRMQESSRRRMMQAVPEADVVITNPTHFAVALKYERDSGKAPVVVAKGEDYLALKIKETAREHEVEIVENKPLARMLYYNVELEAEIPQELYQAVAEVLAFVWKLKNKI